MRACGKKTDVFPLCTITLLRVEESARAQNMQGAQESQRIFEEIAREEEEGMTRFMH